jgi:DNA-binding FadR family transcriptional regulator
MHDDPVSAPLRFVTPLRQIKLSEQIYEQIVGLIVSGDFPDQSKLPTEAELSERFSVSRTIVREALARLRDDGIVVSRQGAGTFVKRRPHPAVLRFTPMGSIADMQRCFEFRVALEGEAAWFAAERGDADGIQRITRAIEVLDEVVRKGNLGADADYEFHFAIAQVTANRFFISVMASLKQHIEFGINLTRSLSLMRPAVRVAQVQAEHRAIYDAVRDGDASGARDAMRKHIENARTRMFEGQAAPLDTIGEPQTQSTIKSQI